MEFLNEVLETVEDVKRQGVPPWLIGTLVTVILTFVINVSASTYWAGKITAQVELQAQQLRDTREDIQKVRAQLDEMNKRSTKN